MLMKMKTTPKDKWTDEMWKWANKQISFISRMSGMQGELYDDKGNKTRKHTSLLIWGHNPKKNTSMKYNKGGVLIPQQGTLYTKDKKSKLEYYKKGDDYAFKVYDVENNPVQNYTRNQYKNRGKDEVLMTYNQFIKYLDSELYIDSKKMADGGEVAIDINEKLKKLGFEKNIQNRYGKTMDEQNYVTAFYDKNKGLYSIRGIHKFKSLIGENSIGIKFDYDNEKDFFEKIYSYMNKYADGGELQGLTQSEIDTNVHNESTNNYRKSNEMQNELNLMGNKKNVYLHHNNNKMPENNYYKQGGDLKYDSTNVKEYFAHGSGNAGGVLVGKRHSEGGIKAINKSTGQPLEMEGGEVVITRNAVSDDKKREFEGEMLTNKEILSRINESGGGVKIFSEGGDIENGTCSCSGKSYKYGGKMMVDYDIAKHISSMHTQPLEANQHNSLKNSFFPKKQELKIVETNDGAIAEIETNDKHEMFFIKSSELNYAEGLPILEVGTIVYSVESNGTMNEWEIEYFTEDSVILSHKPKHKLHNNFENKIISFDELKSMFKDGHIQIKGINNERELGLVLELLKSKINTTTNFKDGGLVFTEYEKEDEEVIEKQFGNKKI